MNGLRSHIKNSKECFIRYPNTSKSVKKTRLRLVFSTHFSVFGYPDETLFLVFDILLPYLFHFPRNIRRKSVPFSYSFFRLYIQELKVLYITFTCSLVHVVLGTELLQRPFFRGGNFTSLNNFFIWTLSGSL